MTFKNILTEKNDAAGIITINRPQVMNALNVETLTELCGAIEQMGADNTLRTIIITGAGEKSFVSGADIFAMTEMSEKDSESFARTGHNLMNLIESVSKPVIAAVNGFALGGGTEIALACDIIYASENAKFGLPEVKLGIYPGFGGTQRLTQLIGIARAKELIFTGRIISALDACELGIVNRVVASSELMTEVLSLSDTISANGPLAIGMAKKLMNDGRNKTFAGALENEQKSFSKLFLSADRSEGMRAFLEKRKPVFNGK